MTRQQLGAIRMRADARPVGRWSSIQLRARLRAAREDIAALIAEVERLQGIGKEGPVNGSPVGSVVARAPGDSETTSYPSESGTPAPAVAAATSLSGAGVRVECSGESFNAVDGIQYCDACGVWEGAHP